MWNYSSQLTLAFFVHHQFERAATICAQQILNPRAQTRGAQQAQSMAIDGQTGDDVDGGGDASGPPGNGDIPTIQIMTHTAMNMMSLRKLTSESITKLIRTPGIIIQTSTLSSRATKLHLQCRACRSIKIVHPTSGLGGMGGNGAGDKTLPRVCDA